MNTNDLIVKKDKLIRDFDDNYRYQFRLFLDWLNNRDLTISLVGEYFVWLYRDSGLKKGTAKNRMSAVKCRIKKLISEDDIHKRAFIISAMDTLSKDAIKFRVNTIPENYGRDLIISNEDYKKMILFCRTDRQRAFLMILWESGMRVSEATGITLDRCDVGPEVVRVRVLGKGRKERTIRLRRELYDYCRATFRGTVYLLETGGGQRYERAYVSAEIRRAGGRIGLKISAHSMRHSFATRIIKNHPGKLDSISEYLGHANAIYTVATYLHTNLTDSDFLKSASKEGVYS